MLNFEVSGGAKKAVRKLNKKFVNKAPVRKLVPSKQKIAPMLAKKTSFKPKPAFKHKSSFKPQSSKKTGIFKPATRTFKSSVYKTASPVVQNRTEMFFRFFMSSIYFAASAFIYYQIFYKYIAHLDEINCKCATDNWKYKTLRIYFIYMLSVLIADFVTLVFNVQNPRTFTSFILDDASQNTFAQFNVLLHVFMVIIANMYIQDLYDNNCECSESEKRDMFTIISVVELLIYALLGLRVFVFLFAYIVGQVSRAVY